VTPIATDSLIGPSTESIAVYSANWTLGLNTFNVTTNGGVGGNAAGSMAFWNAATFPNDQYAQAKINTAGSGSQYTGVAVRCASNGNGYYFYASTSGPASYNVFKRVGGNIIALSGNVTHSFSVGDVLLLTVQGSTVTASQNGVALYSITDTSITSGAAGVSAQNTAGPAMTTWVGGAILTTAPAFVAGPGVSPNAQMQFRGLLPLSSYIQNTLVPLTGQSIASSQGSLSFGFVGQSIFSSQGVLTPLISVALTPFAALATDNLINATTESITTYSPNWTVALNAFNVTSHGGVGNATLSSIAFWNAATFPPSQYAQCTLNGNGSNDSGVAVRCSAGNGYAFYASTLGSAYIVGKVVGGVGVSLSGTVSQTFSIGDVLLLTVIGNVLTAYKNGTQLYQTTDTSLTTGAAGVSAQGTAGPPITSWIGGAIAALGSSTGTLSPFGISTSVSQPATVWNAGPGVGPFANWQFSPRVLGFTNQNSVPLTGTAITSTTGTLGPTNTVNLITAGGQWINALLIQGQWVNTAGTQGGWTSSVYTSTQIVSSTGTLAPIQGALVALVGQSLGSAQGDLSQAGSITVPLVGSLMLSNTGTMTYIIPPGPEADLYSTIQALIEAGLIPQLYYSTSQTVPAGFVISLTPPVGTLVEPNTAVVILASTGPGGFPQGGTTVPNLIGLYWYDATTALAQAFLSIDKYLWQVNAAAEGTVIAQSIAAGTSVPVATIVRLTLSAGPVTVIPPIPVP
jgi:hypothetical protein